MAGRHRAGSGLPGWLVIAAVLLVVAIAALLIM